MAIRMCDIYGDVVLLVCLCLYKSSFYLSIRELCFSISTFFISFVSGNEY